MFTPDTMPWQMCHVLSDTEADTHLLQMNNNEVATLPPSSFALEDLHARCAIVGAHDMQAIL
jgi:hypothetical protein